jgi:7,8-dihydroneopterin aldolase/epimerase/oxygenase
MTRVEVAVDKVRMFAHHGIHAEETIAGGEFEVDVRVEYMSGGMINDLNGTVDYTKVLELIKHQMGIPTPLLETVCILTADRIKEAFPSVTGINIMIRKINPPVANFRGQLSVSIYKTYES